LDNGCSSSSVVTTQLMDWKFPNLIKCHMIGQALA